MAWQDKWNDDLTQFSRLLCEITANIDIEPEAWHALCDAMDLESDQLDNIFQRAFHRWEHAKLLAGHE